MFAIEGVFLETLHNLKTNLNIILPIIVNQTLSKQLKEDANLHVYPNPLNVLSGLRDYLLLADKLLKTAVNSSAKTIYFGSVIFKLTLFILSILHNHYCIIQNE